MHKTVLSIVIPVYRVKDYLEECIQSVLQQDFSEPFRIILLETGSDDGSDEICRIYQERYPDKIDWFHYDENKGISFARNLGILHSMGEYVSFVDGDDILKPCFLSSLYKKAKEDESLQIVFSGYEFLRSSGEVKKAKNVHFDGRGKDALLSFYRRCDFYRGYCWGGIFKREFLLQNHLFFDCDMKMYEDMLFLYRALYEANHVLFMAKPNYSYRQHASSTMASSKDWLHPHLLCLEKFHAFLSLQNPEFLKKMTVSRALKKQIRLDCRKSCPKTTYKKTYKSTMKKLKGMG